MSSLAPLLERFFTDRLMKQLRASSNTIAAYRDTFRLLLAFAHQRLGKEPCQLQLQDLDAPLVGDFLSYLEEQRNNVIRTRNARLAAIHSFFRYAALQEPAECALIQRVLAIPQKRFDRALITYLDEQEIRALLAAPDRFTWIGRRDHAILAFTIQTGLRVSELTQLKCEDIYIESGPYVRCLGKGHKERCTPLTTETVGVLRTWMRERRGQPHDPLFPNRRNGALSRDAVERFVTKYALHASAKCPSLATKHLSPHVLRHTSAMQLLHAGADRSVIALWLGHESIETTEIYLHADLSMKERAIARTAPLQAQVGRYRPPDPLLAFLEAL
jgi:site-specific recombinase XerD